MARRPKAGVCMKHPSPRLLCALAAFALVLPIMAQPNRITRIDPTRRILLRGQLHPRARAAFDQRRVSPSLNIDYVTLTLAQSDAQKADLQQLLIRQQTEGSADYHRWLSPEQFAERFGVSNADLGKITAWLQSYGLNVVSVGRGRTWIALSGSAAQIEAAFQTELHRYFVDGSEHYANATEPSVPEALGGVISAIRGLHNFRLKPYLKKRSLSADYTSSSGNHYLSPNDFSTIYNLNPLYTTGLSGSGLSLAVAGQATMSFSDLHRFRAAFGVPGSDPQPVLVPGSGTPGSDSGDVGESNLDLEWAGAVARNANIFYVYAFDVMQAVQYAIDQNLAPVLSVSYGECEPEAFSSDVTAMQSWAQQAAAQGITWINASGDSGAADCNDAQNPGLAVDIPASIPEVTGMGGTEFQENGGTYWNAANDTTNASALSYIPEAAWNDSAADGQPAATGGGASVLFAKPSWQNVPGVPGDNARHVPDIALNASADHDGYLVYDSGALSSFGGTSAPTPMMAGVVLLLNQYLISSGAQSSPGLGNINPKLYALSQSSPGIFHDITSGDNIVTVGCTTRIRGCSSTPVGYTAGPGYDQVTGLGSMDMYKLVTGWNTAGTVVPGSGVTMTLVSNLTDVNSTDVVDLIATIVDKSGNTPSGTVRFTAGTVNLGTAPLAGSAGTATATLTVNASQLPVGAGSVGSAFAPGISVSATASIILNVSSQPRLVTAAPVISSILNGASFQPACAPGALISVFGSQLSTTTQLAR